MIRHIESMVRWRKKFHYWVNSYVIHLSWTPHTQYHEHSSSDITPQCVTRTRINDPTCPSPYDVLYVSPPRIHIFNYQENYPHRHHNTISTFSSFDHFVGQYNLRLASRSPNLTPFGLCIVLPGHYIPARFNRTGATDPCADGGWFCTRNNINNNTQYTRLQCSATFYCVGTPSTDTASECIMVE